MTTFTFIDFETTGLDPKENFPTEVAIKQIGVSLITGQPFEKTYESLIQLPAGVEISEFIQELTGLTTEKVNSEGKPLAQVITETQEFFNNDNNIIIAQSANFDIGYLAVHFGFEPERFMCTKTIEFLTAPHLSNGLAEVHARYFPEGTFEQTHRAMDDVQMLVDIFNAQLSLHGMEGVNFFMNKIAILPDRPLVYAPVFGKYLDFSQKLVSVKAHGKLQEEVESLREDSEKLEKLEAYGVDNWSGYGEAMSDSEGIFES